MIGNLCCIQARSRRKFPACPLLQTQEVRQVSFLLQLLTLDHRQSLLSTLQQSALCAHASHVLPFQARSKAINNASAISASPSPLAGKANVTEGPTPAKSSLAAADNTECIPDTPDDASASKGVHASVHTAGVHEQATAGVQSIAAPDAATARADPADLPSDVTTSALGQVAVSRSRRMVPESPDEEDSAPVSFQHVHLSQPRLCVPMTHQEAAVVVAPLVNQPLSPLHSQSLHLSLGIHSSDEASCQPIDQAQHQPQPQAQPLAQPQAQPLAQPAGKLSAAAHQSASVMVATAAATDGADTTSGQAAAMPFSARAGIAGQSSGPAVAATGNNTPADVLAPVQPANEAPPAADMNSRAAETAAGCQAPPALATAARTHGEAEAAAAEGATTPAGSRQASAHVVRSAEMSSGSPVNDSALMAALDSAERKFMQVPQVTVSSLLFLAKSMCKVFFQSAPENQRNNYSVRYAQRESDRYPRFPLANAHMIAEKEEVGGGGGGTSSIGLHATLQSLFIYCSAAVSAYTAVMSCSLPSLCLLSYSSHTCDMQVSVHL